MAEKQNARSRGKSYRLAVIGGGRVGQVLGRLMADAGHTVRCVVSRTPASAKAAGAFIGCRKTGTMLAGIPGDVDLLFLSVPHGEVEPVAARIAELEHLRFDRLAACHMSGMLSASSLLPLKKKGARTFSLHPLQTFPRDFHPKDIIESVRGIYYGVDGSRESLKTAVSVAKALGGKTIVVPPSKRPFYHAACVVASNHLTAMMFVLEEMTAAIRPKDRENFFRWFKPIITATLQNVERTSPADALSGPVARGGTETVRGHFEAVRSISPHLLQYFAGMTEETVRLAERKGSVTGGQANELRSILKKLKT